MNPTKDIEEYVQCFNCKGYFAKKDVRKVLAKRTIFHIIQNKVNYSLICTGCLKND